MNKDQSLALAIGEKVALSAYDPGWPSQFEAECERLYALCPDQFVAVEHIGSTAVPGMSAKPIIDILAGVVSMSVADSLLEVLCNSGYATSAEFNATIGNRRWLMRWRDGHRTHHLHIVEHAGWQWKRRLAFRDVLRSNQSVASDYVRNKIDLAAQHEADRETYTAAKSLFIREALEKYATSI